ncbi:MAG: outer membrane protein assembly factor, partial [Pirellulales bacterium]
MSGPSQRDRLDGCADRAAARRITSALVTLAYLLCGTADRPICGAETTVEQVDEVRIEGNQAIPASKIMARVKTRAGRPFDPETVQGDVRALYRLGWFIDVQPFYETVARGRAVIFRVTERSTLRWAKYLGNRKIRDKTLAKETGLKVGDSVDPYAVEEGRRKIEELYRKRGYNKVQVSILDGNKPTDLGATYVINEGQAQRISKVRFIGNTIATGARLKTQIESKPGILWLFRGYVDRAKIDEDVDRLTAYYRSLGFFRAEIGRELDYNDRGNWLTITFVIHEGPRYKVRNVSFLGARRFGPDALAGIVHLKSGKHFNQSEMQRDLSTLRDLYGSQGYVFADVEADPRFLPEPGELDLVYHIEEGKRYRVGEIRVSIKGEYPHTRVQTVLNRLSLRTGDIVDIRKIRADERRLRASGLFLTDPSRGAGPKIVLTPPEMADSEIAERRSRGDSKVRGQSPDEGVISLQLEGRWKRPHPDEERRPGPNNGPRDRRATSVVRGQSPAGGYYQPPPQTTPSTPQYGGRPMGALGPATGNPTAPRTVYQNVPAYGPAASPVPTAPAYGATPSPYGAPPPLPSAPPAANAANPGNGGGYSLFPEPQTTPPPISLYEPSLPLDVQVEETQTGRFMVGVGVNSSAGVIGSVTVDEQNFDLLRFPTSFEDFRNGTAFRGRGQRFRLELLPGTIVQRYLVNFEEPYLFDTPISFGLSGFFYDRRFDDWDEQRIGGRVSLGYQLTPDLATVLSYRGENVNNRNPRL